MTIEAIYILLGLSLIANSLLFYKLKSLSKINNKINDYWIHVDEQNEKLRQENRKLRSRLQTSVKS